MENKEITWLWAVNIPYRSSSIFSNDIEHKLSVHYSTYPLSMEHTEKQRILLGLDEKVFMETNLLERKIYRTKKTTIITNNLYRTSLILLVTKRLLNLIEVWRNSAWNLDNRDPINYKQRLQAMYIHLRPFTWFMPFQKFHECRLHRRNYMARVWKGTHKITGYWVIGLLSYGLTPR